MATQAQAPAGRATKRAAATERAAAAAAPIGSASQAAPLGRTLIIANPQAQSGAAAAAAERLQRFLALYHHADASAQSATAPFSSNDTFTLALTRYPRHATELARQADGYDTVLALGGDGVIHEVVCGLMQIVPARRPALGVVPVGSGNDFARTLGIRPGEDTFARLLSCEKRPFDVCRVRVTAADGTQRTEYVAQTLSCGLDAAIALGTQDLRRRVNLSGAALYLLSGWNVLTGAFRPFKLRARFDDGSAEHLETYFFAVQLGPTYGSGFAICPDADPSDGLLDICHSTGRVNRLTALSLLLRAKNARHTGSPHICLHRARRVELELGAADYPIQADGERLRATRLEVDLLDHALTVLKPLPA